MVTCWFRGSGPVLGFDGPVLGQIGSFYISRVTHYNSPHSRLQCYLHIRSVRLGARYGGIASNAYYRAVLRSGPRLVGPRFHEMKRLMGGAGLA